MIYEYTKNGDLCERNSPVCCNKCIKCVHFSIILVLKNVQRRKQILISANKSNMPNLRICNRGHLMLLPIR